MLAFQLDHLCQCEVFNYCPGGHSLTVNVRNVSDIHRQIVFNLTLFKLMLMF